ncbi:MAG: hypothetical protein QM715_03845 [Nibricoccus sp.]
MKTTEPNQAYCQRLCSSRPLLAHRSRRAQARQIYNVGRKKMLKLVSLLLGIVFFAGFVVAALSHKDGESWKPVLGGAWGSVVFVLAYFKLRNLEHWEHSDDFKEAKREFADLIDVGMSTAEAERLLQERAPLVDVSDRRYFGGRYQNRKFRVSEFDGRLSRVKVLSLDGKVFEVQSEPKR